MTSVYGYSQQPFNDGYHHRYQPGFQSSHLRHNSYYANSGYANVTATTAAVAPTANSYIQPPIYGSVGNTSSQSQLPAYNMNNINSYVAPAPAPSSIPVVEDQPASGGVSSVLDYDIPIMSKFTTYLAFRLFGRADTDNAAFISKLQAVLSAVRLPLSSLILANYFLLSKYEKSTDYFVSNNSDEVIHQNVILSLLLANKANDDNTFTNRSWSDATGLNVPLINSLEANWLALFEWRLHDTDLVRYDELKSQYIKYSDALKNQQLQNSNSAAMAQHHHHQRQQSLHLNYREPVSPLVNNHEFSSPIQDPPSSASSRFNNFQSNWYRQNAYNLQSAGFDQSQYYQQQPQHQSLPSLGGSSYFYQQPGQHQQPLEQPHHHRKNYSLQYEPEYCSRTGGTLRSAYCDCQFCNVPSRSVDWSYNNHITSAY